MSSYRGGVELFSSNLCSEASHPGGVGLEARSQVVVRAGLVAWYRVATGLTAGAGVAAGLTAGQTTGLTAGAV